ncbi:MULTISPECIES: 2'-5' RNA ligase family protein [Streptomyces]|uniref:2'-5' RNA ligase family protein n=2 Tax=Streptomyces TaxID=1883 RepID=A0A3M8ETC4_9ACTN|nr:MULTISPECIES: 2'-5' RNA ligase family protein [Streptomyces]KNE79085.1 phosphoesterase [Streptomyces fradiae]OFA51007.1 phosphoesterase [Streptomyces fradiae]PQM19935.1 2'-5' RNA ligase family protein [Streptomyces xinghaiensis]RKM94062.1 2'-5' RNA ligase family protein [Streptomyces xinghaiensis]RNC69269.1 2'-5' RNA ligase family protein [Streptomyces xinghaiensis]
MGTVTLGVSIAVPEPYGSQLQERRAGFGDTAAHHIPTHVTLLPPTEVDAALLPDFRRHLAEVAAGGRPFAMRLEGTGSFRPVSPVVYVKLAEGMRECSELQELVRSGPVERELQFPYHPHVTVAHGIADTAMDRALVELADYTASWLASGFALYEQGTDGQWRMLREYPFGRDATASGRPVHPSPAGAAAASFPRP